MTELEMIMLDWFGRMVGLPDDFLPFTENGKGGGVIQVNLSLSRYQVRWKKMTINWFSLKGTGLKFSSAQAKNEKLESNFAQFQGSASECNFVSLLAARFEVLKELRQRFPFVEEGLLLSKLVAYCSKEVIHAFLLFSFTFLFSLHFVMS